MQDCAPAPEAADQVDDVPVGHDALLGLFDMSIAMWHQRLGGRLASIGLTLEQWRLLVLTARHGPMNIRALSKATLVPHSTIGRWLCEMERNGLVRRRALPEDQRSVEISIAPRGRRTLMRALPSARLQYETATHGFEQHELRMLADLLSRLKQNLETEPRGRNSSDAPASSLGHRAQL